MNMPPVLEADFNRMDSRGRVHLSGTRLNSDEKLETLIGEQVILTDGEDAAPATVMRGEWDIVAEVDWSRHRDRRA
jgi:hypothetical protein